MLCKSSMLRQRHHLMHLLSLGAVPLAIDACGVVSFLHVAREHTHMRWLQVVCLSLFPRHGHALGHRRHRTEA